MAYLHQVDTGLTGEEKALIGRYLFGVGVWLGLFMGAWKNQNKWLGAGLGAVAGAVGDHAMRRKAPVATVVGAGLGAAGVSLWPYPFERAAYRQHPVASFPQYGGETHPYQDLVGTYSVHDQTTDLSDGHGRHDCRPGDSTIILRQDEWDTLATEGRRKLKCAGGYAPAVAWPYNVSKVLDYPTNTGVGTETVYMGCRPQCRPVGKQWASRPDGKRRRRRGRLGQRYGAYGAYGLFPYW